MNATRSHTRIMPYSKQEKWSPSFLDWYLKWNSESRILLWGLQNANSAQEWSMARGKSQASILSFYFVCVTCLLVQTFLNPYLGKCRASYSWGSINKALSRSLKSDAMHFKRWAGNNTFNQTFVNEKRQNWWWWIITNGLERLALLTSEFQVVAQESLFRPKQ